MAGGLQGTAWGGLWGRQGWGEMLHVHPQLAGTAFGSAERGAEGMEGGWVLVALLWLLLCRAREGEESPCWRPPPCPCVEPAQGLPLSFPCSKTRAFAQHPLLSPTPSATGQWESWTQGLGGSGRLWRSCQGFWAPGWQLPVPDGSGATGVPSPALLLSLFFPSFSPPVSHPLSLRFSCLQPCLLGERRCPHPAAGGRCSIVPYRYRS